MTERQFMRILVVSDTHGDIGNFSKVIRKHKDIDVVVHCGDGADDVFDAKLMFPDKMFIAVRGNCDFCTESPNIETITLEGKKLFITHGHIYNVKYDLLKLTLAGKDAGADLVLFGHTHLPTNIYDDGLYLLNPGSLRGYKGSFALVDISEAGILINLQNLDS